MQAISKIILGTVQFGLDYGIGNISGKPNQSTINEILNYTYQAGVHCLDTAEAYGTAHTAIGYFHATYPNQKFDIITKLPHTEDTSIKSKIDQYLDDLKVERLYGLLFHSYETYKNNKSAFKELNAYKLSGKVQHFGVSVYTNEQIEDVVHDPLIDIIQLPFNLFDNTNLRGAFLKKIKAYKKQVHIRSAFLQGLFFIDEASDNKIAVALKKELDFIRLISRTNEIPMQRLAVNYCLQQSNIDSVLIGVDNLNQLKQNLKYAGDLLSEDIIQTIDEIKIADIDLLNPSLWNR